MDQKLCQAACGKRLMPGAFRWPFGQHNVTRIGEITMLNITTAIKGNILTLTVDLSKNHGMSASGKSNVIASSQGNVSVPGKDEIKFGLNVYTKVAK